jgi:hypothetical protein
MNVWGEWGACSKNCGGGISTRTRKVLRPAAHGGRSCPSPTETKPCNTQGCPVDCVMRPWDPWSPCSEECDGGIQFRHRTIETPALNGGKSCSPDLSENRECNTQGCPVDCITSPWGDWSNCSAKCGEGTKTRERSIIRPPENGGSLCGAPLTETESCNEGPCPEVVECEMSPWSEWGECGFPLYCARDCGPQGKDRYGDEQKTKCSGFAIGLSGAHDNGHPRCGCPGTPTYGSNGKACGSGKRTRTRTIQKQPDSGGTGPVFPCPPLEETSPCELGPCAVDCEMSDWSPWAKCSKTCGGGEQTRTRTVKIKPSNGGKACESGSETRKCNEQVCSVDGKVSQWTAWEDTSKCEPKCTYDCGPSGHLSNGSDRRSSCTPDTGWSGAYDNGATCCGCPPRYPETCKGTKSQRRTRNVTVKPVGCGKPAPTPLYQDNRVDCKLSNCCDPGTYLDDKSVCQTCPVGYSCKGGTAKAEFCPAGFYQNETGQMICKPWTKCYETGKLIQKCPTPKSDAVCTDNFNCIGGNPFSSLQAGNLTGCIMQSGKMFLKDGGHTSDMNGVCTADTILQGVSDIPTSYRDDPKLRPWTTNADNYVGCTPHGSNFKVGKSSVHGGIGNRDGWSGEWNKYRHSYGFFQHTNYWNCLSNACVSDNNQSCVRPVCPVKNKKGGEVIITDYHGDGPKGIPYSCQ